MEINPLRDGGYKMMSIHSGEKLITNFNGDDYKLLIIKLRLRIIKIKNQKNTRQKQRHPTTRRTNFIILRGWRIFRSGI